MTTSSQSTSPVVYLTKSRDKYGRTVVILEHRCQGQAAMVTLPKAYAEKYGVRYLVNFWKGERDAQGLTPVREFVKRADALAWAKGQVLTVLPGAEFVA